MVKNAIKVYARLKPEKNKKNATIFQIHPRPKEHVEEDYLILFPPLKVKEHLDHRPESWNFSFFRIFDEDATQKDVFENVARPVVESVLDGYNGTIFAYGQTGSGKTYSITGDQKNHDEQGIIPRSLQYLFEVIRKHPENVYSVEVSYLEIYNENGYDLLDRRQRREYAGTRLEDLPPNYRRVTIQEDEIGRLHLKNLTFHCVGNEQDAFELLLVGDSNRVTADTPMNPQSSRSHCIFTIVVSTKQFGAEKYRRAKVHLVDLAGSERVYKCAITGTILTEAKHINLSLHYLEQVIVCLGQESTGHIPYRNSLLTAILRDSLGGNCLTTMLATLSISSVNVNETVSTCRFAQRVALIRNDVNLVLEKDVNSENALLRLENERLKQQIESLKNQNTARELTAEEREALESQIRRFLDSSSTICWDFDPKKVQYCFDTFKKSFDLSKDTNSCLKKIEYYRNIVIQRDKEISLLIEMLKKEKSKRNSDTESVCNQKQSTDLNLQENSIENDVPQKEIVKQNTKSDIEKCKRKNERPTKHKKLNLLPCNFINMSLPETLKNDVATTKNRELSGNSNGLRSQLHQETGRLTLNLEEKLNRDTLNSTVSQDDSKNVKKQKKRNNKVSSDKKLIIESEDQKKSPIFDENFVQNKTDEPPTQSTFYYQQLINFNVPRNPLESTNVKALGNESASGISPLENDHSETVPCKPDYKSAFTEKSYKEKKDVNLAETPNYCTANQFENIEKILPLTGEPDIDEEIIAFYKAKRSGTSY